MAAEKLTALRVEKIKNPGYYGDGKGLWLRVKDTGAKTWAYRFMLQGKQREMGLGPYPEVSLADARRLATEARERAKRGIDPIDARHQAETDRKAEALLAAARLMTFDDCAAAYIKAHRAGWKNSKHAQQWENTLAAYASPVFGGVSIADVDLPLVLKALEPIWRTKTETANRLRNRVELIIDWSIARGHRQAANPAKWRGLLDKLLPAPGKIQRTEHFAALPYLEIQPFIQALRQQEGVGRLAFEFCILTASRTSEAIGARWEEVNIETRVWTIPAERMKARKEHTVPLSDRCMAILEEARQLGSNEGHVFPGRNTGKPLSNMAFLMQLRRMGRDDLTAHGFRSTFRDWCAEATAYPKDVIEMALAHAIENKVEAAYRRGDLLEKRRRLMADWAAFCEQRQSAGDVVPIRKTA
ncbi:integrase arm-type DNA-binding domain-containing protein [Chitinivorax sp. PXF-14]|uniref:tyrosine-type recombinase/integrase n=1 Tax=Chitinivorax sp. PXF-14 TaxID=3230488 RepID=UPI00346569A2